VVGPRRARNRGRGASTAPLIANEQSSKTERIEVGMSSERNETTKTIVFAAVAAVLAGAAYFSQPRTVVQSADAPEAGTPFFPDLTLDKIKGLEITDFDAKTAKTDMFRVEYEKGGWVLPLKEGYPADAKDALAKATGWLTSISRDVKLTADKSQHRDLGVLNPTDDKGSDGVGILFRALDENKNVLAELIVGKEVEGKTGWRYVREPKSDVVYRANVGEFSVSTRFRDWIEKDLLELSESVRTVSNASEKEREKYKKTLALAQWTDFKLNPRVIPAQVLGKTTETLKVTGGSEWAPQAELQGLPPNQETNSEKVRDLTDALKNLQIVDVFAKPAGLGPDLKVVRRTGQISEADQAKLQELAQRGFYATEDQDVIPISGELRVETKEGIFYRLRFGKQAILSEEGKVIGVKKDEDAAAKTDDKSKTDDKTKKDDKAKKDDAKKGPDENKTNDQNRFVLIAVGFDESKFPPVADAAEPKLPETKPGEKTDDAAKKKQLEEIRQLQKVQTEEARKKRERDIENGKLRAKELADRYDRWYYVVSNEAYKKLKIDKASFAKAKEEKKDDKGASPPAIPGVPSDLTKPEPKTAANPNVPAKDMKKDEPKTKPANAKKEAIPAPPAGKSESKDAKKSSPEKGFDPKSIPPKQSGKPADATKAKSPEPAKKPPSP
jgi:hypothetical protein